MATPNYDINYNDSRFTDVKNEEKSELRTNNAEYNKAIGTLEDNRDLQLNAIEEEKNTLTKNQNAAHEFAIDKIEQQKAQAQKDYTKEQSAAYVDWQKQSNGYGSTAESMAANGLVGSGYAESSQVAMYNSYQNRISVAREAHALAKQNFDNQMTEARLQNNSILAEIALEALEKANEVIIATATQKSALLIEKAKTRREIKQNYWQRYNAVIDQINEENKLKETVRQHEAEMAYKNAALAEEKRQFNILHPATTSSGGGSGGKVKRGGTGGSAAVTKGGSNNKSKTHASVKEDSGPSSSNTSSGTIDMNSVRDLGYGPISPETLNQYVSFGWVRKYEEDGKIKFARNYKFNTGGSGMMYTRQ